MDTPKLQQTRELYCFNGFRLDTAERRLWFADEAISLKPKQFDLLFYLVRHAGRTATKNELLDAIWADTFVEETTLARNVSWLRTTLGKYADGEEIIETVPKFGYRFTPRVEISDDEDTIIIEKQTVQHFRGEETITIENETPTRLASRRQLSAFTLLFVGLVFVAIVGLGAVLYSKNFKADIRNTGLNVDKNETVKNIPVDGNSIRIGSIVHLQNRSSGDGSYLDAWGDVWSNRRFVQVPTENMFVSTHPNPNRDNGSGSWKVISASGKKDGEPLTVGDKIHLKNMYPDSGYLDVCGWVEHLRVFENFLDQSAAVFTTDSPNRDNGSGIWTIRSATEPDGTPVLEGNGIALESNLNIDDTGKVHIAGFLNVAGSVKDIPSFNKYDGTSLVFTKKNSNDQPVLDIWTITISKTVLK